MIMVNKIWFPEMINAIIFKRKTGNKIELWIVSIGYTHGLEVHLEGINRERKLQVHTHSGWKKKTTPCEYRVEKFCHFGNNCETNELALPKSNLSVSLKLKNTKQRKKRSFQPV